MTKYIVNFSTGLSSFWALLRTIEAHGKENTIAVFADVRGDPDRDPHAAPHGTNWDGEDEDNYRFMADVEKLLDIKITRLQHPDGLGVWGAIFKKRAITIPGQSTFAPCTKLLKQQTMDAFVNSIRGQVPVVQVLGLGWAEGDRIERFKSRVDADVWFPLNEPPYVDNCHITNYLRERGIEPPRAYTQGFPHANCGGGCVKAGQAQWANLLKLNRGRYLYNEFHEDWFRSDINPNVSILSETVDGEKRALPLCEFRARLESNPDNYDKYAWGGCGCFAASPQMRMDDLLLEARAASLPKVAAVEACEI